MPVVKFTNKVSVKPPHIHIKRQTEEFILYFVLSGEMYLKEGSREYALKPGDMLILDPHLVHCGTRASSCTYFYIHFYHDRMAECSGLTGRSTRIIHDILTFFQGSYPEEITSALIEQKYGCNYDYINRLFKKATGKTILAYLNELRISKARQLLSDGTSRISDVAEKCGFRDIYYFSRVFKKYTGTTPGAYSRKYGLSGKKMPLARNMSVLRE